MQFSIHYQKITAASYTIGSILMLLSFSTSAIRVSPLAFDITAAGPGTKKTISVTSDESKPLPVELVITPVDLDSNGQHIKLTDGEDDLMIFPQQSVIPPKKTQTFRVQWVGDPELPQSRGYSISINQVPVEINMPEAEPDKINTAVQIVLNFSIFATVRPLIGDSEFKVRKVELETATTNSQSKVTKKKGTKITPVLSKPSKVVLTIENIGNIHNYICNAKLTLQTGNWSKTFLPQEIIPLLGPGLVLPKHTRRFVLDIKDVPANPGKITATIDMGDRMGLPY